MKNEIGFTVKDRKCSFEFEKGDNVLSKLKFG